MASFLYPRCGVGGCSRRGVERCECVYCIKAGEPLGFREQGGHPSRASPERDSGPPKLAA